MESFDPNRHWTACEQLLRSLLSQSAELVRAEKLSKSTREAPWRLDVEVDGSVKSYVLRSSQKKLNHEYQVLKAMERVDIPTPRVYGIDLEGKRLRRPCFLCDFIQGDSLLKHMMAHEEWAEELYIDTACSLQAVTTGQLSSIAPLLGDTEPASYTLERAHNYFIDHPDKLVDQTYQVIRENRPSLPEVRFSNGDLYPDNMIVKDRQLAGVIDFEHACFSDPIFEFLLPFFLHPELCQRGVEERYCERMGFDPGLLDWYRGLEFYDSLHWVEKLGKPWELHTSESLRKDLLKWLSER